MDDRYQSAERTRRDCPIVVAAFLTLARDKHTRLIYPYGRREASTGYSSPTDMSLLCLRGIPRNGPRCSAQLYGERRLRLVSPAPQEEAARVARPWDIRIALYLAAAQGQRAGDTSWDTTTQRTTSRKRRARGGHVLGHGKRTQHTRNARPLRTTQRGQPEHIQ